VDALLGILFLSVDEERLLFQNENFMGKKWWKTVSLSRARALSLLPLVEKKIAIRSRKKSEKFMSATRQALRASPLFSRLVACALLGHAPAAARGRIRHLTQQDGDDRPSL
jgi:hypothetical protein